MSSKVMNPKEGLNQSRAPDIDRHEGEVLVSVIIPVYNQERFIGRCLRSLLDQVLPYYNFEIIVIDDGSTDRTPYALELFHDAILLITNESNRGLPHALNRGIEMASGKYIVRVDADDYVNRNFLNFLALYLLNNTYKDAVACDYFLVTDEEKVIERVNCSERPIACGIMFQKSHLVEVGMYDEEFLYQEEKEFRIRFEKKYDIGRLELPLYRYRRHENNITNNQVEMEQYRKNLERKHGKSLV